MLVRKTLSACPGLITGKLRRLGFVSDIHLAAYFSCKPNDGGPFASAPVDPAKPPHRQSRNFSSGTASPPTQPPTSTSAPPGTDYLSLFQPPSANVLTGLGAYTPGNVLKVYPLPRYVLKEDIIRHLEVNSMKSENVKFVYNPTFRPDYVQFEVDSAATQRQITKRLQERGRLGCKFLKAELSAPMHWSVVDAALKDSPRGRTLLMYNVNPGTDYEDVERFFCGYSFDASYIRFVRVTNEQSTNRAVRRPNSVHVAVGFTSRLEALRAQREKTGDFCANMAVNLRLIQ